MEEPTAVPQAGEKRGADEAIQKDKPKLKRKKTVTWADGEVQLGEDELDEDGSDMDVNVEDLGNVPTDSEAAVQGQGQRQALNGLFAALDESALLQQEPLPKSEQESLTRSDLYRRRIHALDNLMAMYSEELWALADELQLTHAEYSKTHPDIPPFKQEDEGFKSLKERLAVGTSNTTNTGEQQQQLRSLRDIWEKEQSRKGEEAQQQNSDGLGEKSSELPTAAVGPSYQDLEQLILALPTMEPSAQASQRSALVSKKQLYLQRMNLLGRLEASALAATGREMDHNSAVAVLCGSNNRYFLAKTAVVLGRKALSQSSASQAQAPKVDVDLAYEIPLASTKTASDVHAKKDSSTAAAAAGGGLVQGISRQQAHIFLDVDGVFKLKNIGRRAVMVNGVSLSKGQYADLPTLSFISVSGIGLLFIVNQSAVERILARALSV